MMKVIIFSLLTLSVILSGCIGYLASSRGTGEVSVNQFSFTPDSMLEKQKTFLYLELQNGGTFPVDNVTVLLYGLNPQIKIIEKLVSSNHNASGTDTNILTTLGTIYPPSTALQAGGERRSIKWLVEHSGAVLKGQRLTQKAYARVCYDYKTEAKGKMEFISDAEYLLQKERGGLKEGSSSFQSTDGPLQLHVQIPQPVIFGTEVPLEIKIVNVGSGFAIGAGASCGTLNLSTINQANLSIVSKSNTLKCDLEALRIFLKRGDAKTETIYCTYNQPESMPKITEEIGFKLAYGYYTDAEAALSVRGSRY